VVLSDCVGTVTAFAWKCRVGLYTSIVIISASIGFRTSTSETRIVHVSAATDFSIHNIRIAYTFVNFGTNIYYRLFSSNIDNRRLLQCCGGEVPENREGFSHLSLYQLQILFILIIWVNIEYWFYLTTLLRF